MGAGRIDAVGGNTVVLHAMQDTFGLPKALERRLHVELPEEFVAELQFTESEEPTPQRGTVEITQTSRNAGGALNYAIRTEGMGAVYQMALGSPEDVVTIHKADGGIRANVSTDYAGGTALVCKYIPPGFPSAGLLAIAYRTTGNTAKQLIAVTAVEYSSITGTTTFNLTAPIAGTPPIKEEDFVFLYGDGTAGTDDLTGVYTHMYQAGRQLDSIGTLCILRDIVAFYYYDSKVNTLGETYDNQAVIKGTVEVVAGDEWWCGRQAADTTVGADYIQLDDLENEIRDWGIFYPNGGTIWLGEESGIDFSGVDTVLGRLTGIPTSGDTSIESEHLFTPERQVVAPSSVPDLPLTVTDAPLAAYNAGIWYAVDDDVTGVKAIEVLSANFSLNNNLFTEKIPLGQKNRAALPPGKRQTTGVLHVEFDSPIEYHRVRRGTKGRIEILGIDELSDINNTGVRKRNDTIFPNTKFTGSTPTAANSDLIEYDLNFTALVATRLPEIVKITVTSQSSALASG